MMSSKRWARIGMCAAVSLSFLAAAAWSPSESGIAGGGGSASVSAPSVGPAAGIIDTRIHDLEGRLHRIGVDAAIGPVILVFVDPDCPISRRYIPYLKELAKQMAGERRSLYGVISDPMITASDARGFGRQYEVDFPLLWDASGDLAQRLKPQMVPEAFVVDGHDRIAYRGRIDNRFESPGKLRGVVTQTDLADAVSALAAGRRPPIASTQPVGCYFEAWDSHDLSRVTYERDVAPILEANCTECHTQGGIGPFALDSYQSAKRRAGMSAWAASERLMPPWKAQPGFGHFRSQRFLSDHQIEVLGAWARSQKTLGDASDRIPYERRTSTDWRLGAPDLVIEMPEAFEVPASGDDIYRYFVVPGALAKGGMIRGIDFRPGDPSVVHHAILYVDYGKTARRLDEADPGPGFSAFGAEGLMGAEGAMPIGGWAPGADPYELPRGMAIEIPPGADFVFEIHYHLTGRATRDKSSAALYWAAHDEVERSVDGLYLATESIDIPAGESNYERRLSMEVPADIDLVDISPHMHYLGRSARVSAALPGGGEIPLIHIADWDFRWQNVYVYRRPVRLPAGSRIEAVYSYDNSSQNPANPNSPPRRVKWGPQSTDEMCELYLTYLPVDPKDASKVQRAMLASLRRSSGSGQWLGKTSTAEQGRQEPYEALREHGLWNPRSEEMLLSLDESEFSNLLKRAESASKEQAESPDAQALLGGLLLAALLFESDEERQLEIALAADRALGRALRLDAAHWDARLLRAVLYLVSEEKPYLEAAVRILDSLLQDQANQESQARFAKTYVYLGDAHAALGRRDAAARLWREGLSAYPDDAELKARTFR